MSSRRSIVNERTGKVILARARIRASFLSRLIGLSLRGRQTISEGALFIGTSRGRFGSAIHTLAVRAPIGVVWLSADFKVVDKRLANPWRIAHVPTARAMYYVEAAPCILERVNIGDQVRIDMALS